MAPLAAVIDRCTLNVATDPAQTNARVIRTRFAHRALSRAGYPKHLTPLTSHRPAVVGPYARMAAQRPGCGHPVIHRRYPRTLLRRCLARISL